MNVGDVAVPARENTTWWRSPLLLLLLLLVVFPFLPLYPRAPIVRDADFVVYAVVFRVVAVVGSFEKVSAAAAAVAVVYVVVGVVAVPICCRPPAPNTRYVPPGTNFDFFVCHYNQKQLAISFSW